LGIGDCTRKRRNGDLMVAGMLKRDLLKKVLFVFGMWKTP
jgi:hypothetical protein